MLPRQHIVDGTDVCNLGEHVRHTRASVIEQSRGLPYHDPELLLEAAEHEPEEVLAVVFVKGPDSPRQQSLQ